MVEIIEVNGRYFASVNWNGEVWSPAWEIEKPTRYSYDNQFYPAINEKEYEIRPVYDGDNIVDYEVKGA